MCDYIGDWPPRGRCLKGMKRKHEKNQVSLDKQKETSRDKRKRMCLNKEKERLEMGKEVLMGTGDNRFPNNGILFRQSIHKNRFTPAQTTTAASAVAAADSDVAVA